MKNELLFIADKLRGYLSDTQFVEVVGARKTTDDIWVLECKIISEPENEASAREGNDAGN